MVSLLLTILSERLDFKKSEWFTIASTSGKGELKMGTFMDNLPVILTGILTLIILLIVLWRIVRSVDGLYRIMVYMDKKIDDVQKAVVSIPGVSESLEVAKQETKKAAAQAQKRGKPAARSIPNKEEKKQKILDLLKQEPGMGYDVLSAKLGLDVNVIVDLCKELENDGRISEFR